MAPLLITVLAGDGNPLYLVTKFNVQHPLLFLLFHSIYNGAQLFFGQPT